MACALTDRALQHTVEPEHGALCVCMCAEARHHKHVCVCCVCVCVHLLHLG